MSSRTRRIEVALGRSFAWGLGLLGLLGLLAPARRAAAGPLVHVSPTTIGFGSIPIGQTVQFTTTITNTGASPLTGWAGGAVAAPFGASQDCNIPGGVLPGNSCHYFFSFTPTAAGPFSATSNSTALSGATPVSISIALTGTGVATPLAKITPTTIGFGGVPTGQNVQLVTTITNTSTHNLTGWAGGAVSAPFNASQDCNIPGGVPPGASCHYFFTFSPTAGGPFSATSNSSAQSGAQTVNISVALTGTGISAGAPLQVNPTTIGFGSIPVDDTIQATVTLRNTGASPLTGWAGGAVPAPFNGSQDCNIPGGVLPGQSCHFFYSFSPTSTGAFSSTSNVSLQSGATPLQFSVALTGTGVAVPVALVTPTTIGFGDLSTGLSAQLSTAITNTSTRNLTGWAGGAVPAPFNGSQDCNIAGGLPPGQTCHYYFTFAPTTAGLFSATSNSSAQSGSQTLNISVAMTGNGLSAASSFHPLTPCRILDTRDPNGPYGGPAIALGSARTFVALGRCGIPPSARVLSVNLTVTAATAGGTLRVFAAGTSDPFLGTISYGANQTRANNALVNLGIAGDFTVATDQASGAVHAIVDVNGWFE